MKFPSWRRPANARWIKRNFTRIHWARDSRYKQMSQAVIRDPQMKPLIHKGKKPTGR